MRRLLGACLLACCLLACCLPLAAAERVVSLAPSLSEIMLELGAAGQLVGVLDGDQRPAALAGVPSVGRYGQLDLERLLSLKPDLILLWPASVSPAQREQLERFAIPLYIGEPADFAALAEQFAAIGERVGRAERGRQLAESFTAGMAELRARYRRQQPLPVFYQVWHEPPFTIGGRQIVSQALEVCGARNVFADIAVPAAQVNVESVLQRDPAVILGGSPAELALWKPWTQLQAVRREQLWTVPDKGLERPSYQMLAATEKLCALLAKAH
ncbi:cobalamin-binding protein [Pseudomonas alcaligenes]|uniref:Cobalamin-binding protein n=1 Tax=Aquipseudomonas alcaligenes TaxID=43263 RepID=A0ABR7S5P9_AQUAC|nr:cobalamin-binding protein [Pseudomonas alcaligenes]MBC9252337.1 cobalamin-binding protein [Pseudomonas alcaligenes]